MKVIFLDIDGVMVTGKVMHSFTGVFPDFSQTCVACLNDLTRRTGAKLVISSTWRWAHPKYLDLIQFLKDQGVEAEVVGMTPRVTAIGSLAESRGFEISSWLEDNPVDSFVILDDDDDMGELLDKLVKTEFDDGLLPPHVERAQEILDMRES